jgi:peptidoglycan/xylan/chitin deacetylase (PgdA/CDA1 family)
LNKPRKIVALTFIALLTLGSSLFLICVNGSSSGPVVSIVFDDGTASQYDAFLLMSQRGIQGTFYVVSDFVGSSGYLSSSQLLEMQQNGNEIGSHSASHLSFIHLSESRIRDQCLVSKQKLESYGLQITSFAYPYGDNNAFTDSIVKDYYGSARDSYNYPNVMSVDTDQFVLTALAGETSSGDALDRLISHVSRVESGEWVVVFFHKVVSGLSSPRSGSISSQDFEGFLDYLQRNSITTRTVNEVLTRSSPDPTPTPVPTPDPTSTPSPTSDPSMSAGDWERYYDWLVNESLNYWKNNIK